MTSRLKTQVNKNSFCFIITISGGCYVISIFGSVEILNFHVRSDIVRGPVHISYHYGFKNEAILRMTNINTKSNVYFEMKIMVFEPGTGE